MVNRKLLQICSILNMATRGAIIFYETLNVFFSEIKNNSVARTPKKLRTPKGDYWIKQWFSSIASLFKMRTSERTEFAPRESEFFSLLQFLISLMFI